MTDIAISLHSVSKKYFLHHEKPTLVERLIHGPHEEFWALKNINILIRKGEKVGLIGKNGAGKTTLLKIISGITRPTSGSVHVAGRVVSVIDITAGFHPDLTGEQNIYINGALLGMTLREMKRSLDSIIKFAGIGKFIDIPLRTYSNGMMLRLGYSVAIHSKPDILLLDEYFLQGDRAFRRKASEVIERFFRLQKTVIIASHWYDYLNDHCSTVYELRRSRVLKRSLPI